jgi:hypothetical protein
LQRSVSDARKPGVRFAAPKALRSPVVAQSSGNSGCVTAARDGCSGSGSEGSSKSGDGWPVPSKTHSDVWKNTSADI